MKAIVKTKSNYKNCNGKKLDVVQLLNSLIALSVPEYGFDENGTACGKYIVADFSVSELVELSNE